jgi:hypothetical protein
MRYDEEKIEINSKDVFPWESIKTIRILNEKLIFELKAGRVIELSNLHPSTIDGVFRAYEHFVQMHPSKKQ